MKDAEMQHSVEKIATARQEILQMLFDNDVEANEALSLLSGMLIEFYDGLVEDATKQRFLKTIGECYDSFLLIRTPGEGSVH